MMTLRQLAHKPETVPTRTSWYLSELGEAKGKFALYARQSPQKLKVLREHALIESAVSSNRIEGVEVDQSRIATIVFGKSAFRNRDEEEVRGYRDALKWIHEQSAKLPITEATILRFHKLCRGEIWDAGKYKDKDVDIIQTYADGRTRVRFKSVPAKKTRAAMEQLTDLWTHGMREKWVPPLVLAAGVNLDFLCIHPFRDGNGRVSRLLFLLACYHSGMEVGRYISLERIIEENKERYYEVLEESSHGWHEGKHDPWPTINFLLFILRLAYKEFEERIEHVKSPRGAKSEMVQRAIERIAGEFSVTDLERLCPAVSRETIQKVLGDLKDAGKVESLRRGPGAKWRNMVLPLKKGKKEGKE